MLIEVSDVSTIPIEIEDIIFQSFSGLPKDVIDRIGQNDDNRASGCVRFLYSLK